MIFIRAFIGIDFSPDMRNYITEIQQKLRKYAIRGRWKHSDNFHLTLKFLDEVSPEQQEQINSAMLELESSFEHFSLGISGLGAFEGRERGNFRVVWLGLNGDIPILKELQKNIENKVAPIGFPTEKRGYTPHITIGQDIVFKSSFDEIHKAIGEVNYIPENIGSLYLFKSEQIQNKRVYTKVSDYQLG